MSESGDKVIAKEAVASSQDNAGDVLQAWAADAFAPAISRTELVETLRSVLHLGVTERQLRSWASYGVIPLPERRAIEGGKGKARALYPRWMLHVILGLVVATEKGATIADLKLMAPQLIRRAQEEYLSDSLFIQLGEDGLPVRLAAPRIPRGLQRTLWAYAERYSTQASSPVERMTLVLHRADGSDVQVAVGLSPSVEGEDRLPDIFLIKADHEG